ncbi:MAG: HEAT repeat domain-containing protein [Luteolibacter sp.]
MKTPRSWLLMILCHLTFTGAALGYPVGPAPKLDKLAEESDFIFKGEAIASGPVQDEWFKPVSGYEARETRFRIISPIKGEAAGGEVRFRHYDEQANILGIGISYTPQFYHFEAGRTYVVVAHKTDAGARQIRPDHTSKMDLGVLRCRDQQPVTAKALPEIMWTELIALRDSPVPDDVVYAIQQMDGMSESPGGYKYDHTQDFSRIEVLSAVSKLISRPEPAIAQAAIRVIGDGSPYLSDDLAPYWLGTVGVEVPGLAQLDRGTRNAGGALAWRELVAVANSNAAPETRALAIRAMGLVKMRDIHQKFMRPWLEASEIPVRAAAVLLLTDFARPGDSTTGQFAGFATDPAPEVRKCAAYAIGFMQNPGIVPVLSKLIKDEDPAVRRAALESLHSFRPDIPTVAAALKQDLANPESGPLSLLALARQDPGAHLEELAQVIEKKTSPNNWSGGEIPAFTAWKLLFKHLQAQPAEDIRAGKWDRFLDAFEKVGQYSSSEPRDIYAFYLQREMPERAAKYRALAKKAVTYDMDYYFDMVDKSPSTYQGN